MLKKLLRSTSSVCCRALVSTSSFPNLPWQRATGISWRVWKIQWADHVGPPQATASAAETLAAAPAAVRIWSARTSSSICEGTDDNHEVSFGGEQRRHKRCSFHPAFQPPKPIGRRVGRQSDAVDGHNSLLPGCGRLLRSEGEEERYLAPIQF